MTQRRDTQHGLQRCPLRRPDGGNHAEAEAEAEKDRLHGVGIVQQRKAIVDGLAESIAELKEANVGMSEEQIMSILLTNQYLDTLNTFADKGNQTLFLPNNPNGVDDIHTQILSSLKVDNKK